MEIKLAVEKTSKYAVSESGDSIETVERPKGGLTGIVADGQGSGKFAKLTSNLVVTKAMSLIADGARDGAVARAVGDYLYTLKDGKVSTTFVMLSADLSTNSIVVSRNINCPVYIKKQGEIIVLNAHVEPLGFHKNIKPSISEMDIVEDTIVVAFSDGIYHAGRKYQQQITEVEIIDIIQKYQPTQVNLLAQHILEYAIDLDYKKPSDDMTVMVMGISKETTSPRVRRLSITYPF